MENLFEGADYLFRVFAENKVGASEKAAELQIAIRAKMPYGKIWATTNCTTRFQQITISEGKKTNEKKNEYDKFPGWQDFIIHLEFFS